MIQGDSSLSLCAWFGFLLWWNSEMNCHQLYVINVVFGSWEFRDVFLIWSFLLWSTKKKKKLNIVNWISVWLNIERWRVWLGLSDELWIMGVLGKRLDALWEIPCEMVRRDGIWKFEQMIFRALGRYNEKNVSWYKYTLYVQRVWEFYYRATNEGKARVLVLIW